MATDSDRMDGPGERFEHPRWLYAESMRIISADCRPVHPKLRDARTSHPFWAVYLAPGSGLSFRLDDGSEHHVDGRSSLLIPPWLPFRHRFDGNACRHCYVLFSLPLVPPQVGLQACGGPVRLRSARLLEAHRLLADGAAAMSRLERALHGQVVAARTMLGLLDALPPVRRDLLRDPEHAAARLQPALDLIDARLTEAIPVTDLAERLSCSVDHCTRLFRQHLGQSPVAYMISRRVQHAAMLMTDSGMSLDEIAGRCGFANRQYLSRQFQRHLGIAPSQYRHMAHRHGSS